MAAPRSASQVERDAIHHLMEARKFAHRSYGHLCDFHTDFGRSMDHVSTAAELLRESGRAELARRLEQHLGKEIPQRNEMFRSEVLGPLADCEEGIRHQIRRDS